MKSFQKIWLAPGLISTVILVQVKHFDIRTGGVKCILRPESTPTLLLRDHLWSLLAGATTEAQWCPMACEVKKAFLGFDDVSNDRRAAVIFV